MLLQRQQAKVKENLALKPQTAHCVSWTKAACLAMRLRGCQQLCPEGQKLLDQYLAVKTKLKEIYSLRWQKRTTINGRWRIGS